jgi:copper resistance protein C
MKVPEREILGSMQTMSIRGKRIAMTVVVLLLALWPAAAFGHGETTTTDPKNGATLGTAPKQVAVTLTEPPAKDAELEVVDGCGDIVSANAEVDGQVLSTEISKGEPGNWEASYRIVSAVDGHPTKDAWTFKVDGKKDCSADEPKEPKGNGTPNSNDDGDGGGTAQGPEGEDDGSSFPVVPVAAGTAALVGLALFIRTRAG